MAESKSSAKTALADEGRGTLYLGCPVWACDQWKGTLFTRRASRREWLPQYTQVFNTVEGNSTFYALPTIDTVKRWADTSAEGFRFALKFPRAISHDRRLVGAERETEAFVQIVRILHEANRAGPAFLQLPPDFAPQNFDTLQRYLTALPDDLQWAVEVRDHDWFDGGRQERQLDQLLRSLGINKVLFDSRPLYSKPPTDEPERISQSRKPKTPIRRTVTGNSPFLRLVGRNTVMEATQWIREWTPYFAQWIGDGMTPFVFTHTPNDRYAPDLARLLVRELQAEDPLTQELPDWPGEVEAAGRMEQGLLF
jgi:uncharacterized protein YecE (DUF72 family)